MGALICCFFMMLFFFMMKTLYDLVFKILLINILPQHASFYQSPIYYIFYVLRRILGFAHQVSDTFQQSFVCLNDINSGDSKKQQNDQEKDQNDNKSKQESSTPTKSEDCFQVNQENSLSEQISASSTKSLISKASTDNPSKLKPSDLQILKQKLIQQQKQGNSLLFGIKPKSSQDHAALRQNLLALAKKISQNQKQQNVKN